MLISIQDAVSDKACSSFSRCSSWQQASKIFDIRPICWGSLQNLLPLTLWQAPCHMCMRAQRCDASSCSVCLWPPQLSRQQKLKDHKKVRNNCKMVINRTQVIMALQAYQAIKAYQRLLGVIKACGTVKGCQELSVIINDY